MKTLLLSILLTLATVSAFGQAQEKIVNAYGTVPELLQLNPNRYNNVVAVQGLSTTTDGQGGVFAYFPTSITATNTTNVFKPAQYDGRWVRMFPNLAGSGGVGNMINTGAAAVGEIPVATDTTGNNWTPTNTLSSLIVTLLTLDVGANQTLTTDGSSNVVGVAGLTTTWTNLVPGVITQRLSTVSGILVTNLTL